MFQHRHFEAIAAEIMTWDFTNMHHNECKAQIVLYLVAFFMHHNHRFDENRFVKACESFEGELLR